MRPRLLPGLLLLALTLGACGRSPSTQKPRTSAGEGASLARCRAQQRSLPALLQQFQDTQAQLSALEGETYSPSPGPTPLDPDEQRRLTIYDQQTEQQLYDEAYAAWSRREAERRDRWWAERNQREQQIRATLAARAAALRAVSPALLLPGQPLRLNQPQLERWLACRPEQFR